MTTPKQLQLINSITLEEVGTYKEGYVVSNTDLYPRYTDGFKEIITMAYRNNFYGNALSQLNRWKNYDDKIDAYQIKFLNKFIGYIVAKETNEKGHYWANFLLIDKKYQNKGFGSHAMKIFEKLSKDKNMKTLIDIDLINPQYNDKAVELIRFYRKQGYNIVGVNEDGNLAMEKGEWKMEEAEKEEALVCLECNTSIEEPLEKITGVDYFEFCSDDCFREYYKEEEQPTREELGV